MSTPTTTPTRTEVQGEGDYDAARRYDKAAREFAESGKVEPAAHDAAPDNRPAKPKSSSAPRQNGKSHSKGEGPLVSSKRKAATPSGLATRQRAGRHARAERGRRGAGGTRADFGLRTARRDRAAGAARARRTPSPRSAASLLRARVDERDDRRERIEQRQQRRRARLAGQLAELERDRRLAEACRLTCTGVRRSAG